MRYGSVCSGIEAATVAWHPLGWEPAFFSEIEPFPCAVLKHHYPSVPNYGDMTKFKEWPDDANINVLVGGTPCQSFSVAGLRQGLDDPRGNLMLTFGAIADKYRPTWLVWENVPGVLSSNGGRDFGTFLGMLGELGYGFAYRTLDAQFFGVAQRRRRVFVVGHLGDWRRAAAVLFERESLSGHPAPRRQARQTAPTIPSRSTAGGGLGTDFDCDGGLVPTIANPLTARMHKGINTTCDEGQTMIPVGFDDVARTLSARHDSSPCADRGMDVVAIRTANTQANGHGIAEGVAHTLDQAQGQAVAYKPLAMTVAGMFKASVSNALDSQDGSKQRHIAVQQMQVRRLTPVECARLQGFPDNYLDIPFRNRPACDGPKYKALGNSMAVPVMAWIGKRIELINSLIADNMGER